MSASPLAVAVATVLCCTAAPTQHLAVVVELAADPGRDGPSAWTALRDRALTAAEPFAALRLRIADDFSFAAGPGDGPTAGYAEFALIVDGATVARGRCARDGTERWQVDRGALPQYLPQDLACLVARFGTEAASGWLDLDLGSAVGNLLPAALDRDPLDVALTLGAHECGDLALVARARPDGLAIVGRSRGGLALPAVLLAIAARRSAVSPQQLDDDPVARWLLLAASAQFAERAEAARQLSRFDDPRAIEMLERLRYADGVVQLVAAQGLARIAGRSSAAQPARGAHRAWSRWIACGAAIVALASLGCLLTLQANARSGVADRDLQRRPLIR